MQEDRELTAAERAEFERREHGTMLDEAVRAVEQAVVMLAEALVEEPGDSDRPEALRGLLRSRDQLRCITAIRFGEEAS